MAKVITLQPAAYTDHITEDGTELTKLPYPYHVSEDGSVGRQDFWHGQPNEVVGFAYDLATQQVDLWWVDAYRAPERCLGMYVVTRNYDGSMATLVNAVESYEVNEVDA